MFEISGTVRVGMRTRSDGRSRCAREFATVYGGLAAMNFNLPVHEGVPAYLRRFCEPSSAERNYE